MKNNIALNIITALSLLALNLLFQTCGDNSTEPEDDASSIKDIDGNVYKTVKIGNQVWMAENLKVTHYRNGNAIPNVTDNLQWTNLTTGAYSSYNNDPVNTDTYGLLYNWYAVNDSRNIAPVGWHVPTGGEWRQLESYLGMSQDEMNKSGLRGTDQGGKMKAKGTLEGGDGLWHNPNSGATNESGFLALPGGYRAVGNGSFYSIGYNGYWWSATEYDLKGAWNRELNYDNSRVGCYSYFDSKPEGYSVRCIRD